MGILTLNDNLKPIETLLNDESYNTVQVLGGKAQAVRAKEVTYLYNNHDHANCPKCCGSECAVPENIQTTPTEGLLFCTPTPPRKF